MIIIFHCEFSQKRGPKMYRYFKKKDREFHESTGRNGMLTYPHVYLLEGGYSRFVKFSPVDILIFFSFLFLLTQTKNFRPFVRITAATFPCLIRILMRNAIERHKNTARFGSKRRD